MTTVIVIMILCVLAEGFFAGSEIAIVSVNRVQLRHLVEKGSSRARALSRLLERPEWFLGTTLLGTNLSTITLNAVATWYVIRHWGHDYEMATVLVTWPLILIFGEVIPKTLYQRFADRIAPYLVFPLRIASLVLFPLVYLMAWVGRVSVRLSGIQRKKATPLLIREELEFIYQASEREEGPKAIERSMVNRIFAFSDKQVREVMIPLPEVVSIRENATVAEATREMRRSGFSRLPVYADRVYRIVGWVNHFDLLLSKDRKVKVKETMRPVRFVPQFAELDRLLVSMQKKGDSIAVVVDEYGGAMGIVTLEDILEEVVGEIEDEFDPSQSYFKRVSSHQVIVNGRMSIQQLSELLRQQIPRGEYETVGGLLMAKLQRIPQVGEEFKTRRLTFRVRQATDRNVEEVEIFHS